jgi:protein involved in polysaccharide export with SLBB domain
MSFFFHRALWVICAVCMVGCTPVRHAPNVQPSDAISSVISKVIQSQDVLHVTVADEENLTGFYTVNLTGNIEMPLVGSLNVSGKTLDEVKDVITKAYADGFLLLPKIAVVLSKSCDCTSLKIPAKDQIL